MEPSAADPFPRGSLWEARRRLHALFLSPSRIDIAFQPILDLNTERTVGVEALARFASGAVPVPSWLQGAQVAGIGVEVEVQLARVALAKLPEIPPTLFLSVNVSPQALVSAAFSSCIAEHDITRVVFEITEHTPFPDPRPLAIQMAKVRERGGRIALDDVGSGYTSIRHVLELAPEFIKLDRTMIVTAEHETHHRAMIRGLTCFAEEAGSSIVAEGIETRQQLDMLRGLGVGLGQGFLWGRPGPLSKERTGEKRRGPAAAAHQSLSVL
ncbi:MAG: EAL domain-containing protein [Actinomycetota bacterium]